MIDCLPGAHAHALLHGTYVDALRACARAEYNSIRFVFTLLIALFFGTAFWQMGSRRSVDWPSRHLGMAIKTCRSRLYSIKKHVVSASHVEAKASSMHTLSVDGPRRQCCFTIPQGQPERHPDPHGQPLRFGNLPRRVQCVQRAAGGRNGAHCLLPGEGGRCCPCATVIAVDLLLKRSRLTVSRLRLHSALPHVRSAVMRQAPHGLCSCAGYYAPLPYGIAQGTVELPCVSFTLYNLRCMPTHYSC